MDCAYHASSGANTTKVSSGAIAALSAMMALLSSGSPASDTYCFGTVPPKRFAPPAAMTSAYRRAGLAVATCGLQVFGEKLFHRLVEIELVLFVVKAVALVVLDHVGHVNSARTQRIDHLVRFIDVDARIARTLGDEQRGLDLVGIERGSAGRQKLLVLFW